MTELHIGPRGQQIALGALLVLALLALRAQLPEIRRYLRVRAM
jgi:hypothetical protein